MFPTILEPNSYQLYTFSLNRKVYIPKVNINFNRCEEYPVEPTYNKKPVLDYNGERVFAEIAILRIFQNEGWNGVWVDSSRRKYRTGYWNDDSIVNLPKDKESILDDIYKMAGIRTGCWDVYCWKGNKVVFANSKRGSKDKGRHTEIRWLNGAFNYGLKEDSFLIVEWTLSRK